MNDLIEKLNGMSEQRDEKLEDAAVQLFKAIMNNGIKCIGHNNFVFKVDITIGVGPGDLEGQKVLNANLQVALNAAQKEMLAFQEAKQEGKLQ
jgi:hypothetical protein